MVVNNSNSKVGFTDPNSGAVYTSGINSSGMSSGIGSGSGMSSFGMGSGMSSGMSGMSSGMGSGMGSGMSGMGSGMSSGMSSGMGMTNSTSSMGFSGSGNSGVDVQQIKQQLQNIQSQLRQTPSYTEAANRLQDVYDSLNNSR
jgi:hypothetical protein